MGELMEIENGMNETAIPPAVRSEMEADAMPCPHCGSGTLMAVVQVYPFILTETGALRTPTNAEKMLPDNLDFRCGSCEEVIRASEVGVDPNFLMESTAQEFDLRMVLGSPGDSDPASTIHVPLPTGAEA